MASRCGKGMKLKRIAIIGGGLGGLVAGNLLSQAGFAVTLFEKKRYPFHRVCGEYVSNEVKNFLIKNKLFPEIQVPSITKFQYTSVKGKSMEMPLDLGAFGVSRHYFDHFLVEKARNSGVQLQEGLTIVDISKHGESFQIEDNQGHFYEADLVVGAYGKTSRIDKRLDRAFTQKPSPYIGVKYHIKTDFAKNKIALHNFEGGYCGLSAIEDDKYNLCYLGQRASLKKYGDIPQMEDALLKQNPFLKNVLENSEFLLDQPVVINAFSFAPKKPVEHEVFMIGDAAGLITPLCGNGMALAIHSAKVLSDLLIEDHSKGLGFLKEEYTKRWTKLFAQRLWIGRQTQKLFGSKTSSELAVGLMQKSPWIARKIMANTHGQPF